MYLKNLNETMSQNGTYALVFAKMSIFYIDHFGINNLPKFKIHTEQKKDDHQTTVGMVWL
jgi:hypothetical protein